MKAVILNDTSFDFHHGCSKVMENIVTLLNNRGIHVIGTNPVGVDWQINSSFLNNLAVADIVIVNGEGTIHHSQSRAKELVKISKYAKK